MRDTKTKGEVVSQCPGTLHLCWLSICLAYEKFIVPFPIILQVFGFGVHLLRWMLMVPKFLSFI